jgi:hypothetical protein
VPLDRFARRQRALGVRPRIRARALFLALIVAPVPTAVGVAGLVDDEALRMLALAGCAACLFALGLAVRDRLRGGEALGIAIAGGVLGGLGAAWNAFLAFLTTVTFAHGRPFRHAGRAVTARPRAGGGWTDETRPAGARDEEWANRSRSWGRDGLAEHASVASFARLVLDLLAVGAPAELVAAASRAQAEEIEHARLCFSLASAYAGRPVGPGPLPEAALGDRRPLDRALRLRQLAVESLRDGCWGEQRSADELAARAAVETDPAVRAVLERLAADEQRHADLGWRIVEHCLAEDPSVRPAILEESFALEVAGARGVAHRARALL